MRTYLADGQDAEVILRAARKLREQAHTLTGDAAGVEVDADIVADLLQVIGADPGIGWESAAERLARRGRSGGPQWPSGDSSPGRGWPPSTLSGGTSCHAEVRASAAWSVAVTGLSSPRRTASPATTPWNYRRIPRRYT